MPEESELNLQIAVQTHPREQLLDALLALARRCDSSCSSGGRPCRTTSVTLPSKSCGTSCGKQRDLGPGRQRALAMIGLHRAGENSHQRRLAGAVASQQTDPLAGLDLTGHAVQQRRSAKTDAQVVELNEGHGVEGIWRGR